MLPLQLCRYLSYHFKKNSFRYIVCFNFFVLIKLNLIKSGCILINLGFKLKIKVYTDFNKKLYLFVELGDTPVVGEFFTVPVVFVKSGPPTDSGPKTAGLVVISS